MLALLAVIHFHCSHYLCSKVFQLCFHPPIHSNQSRDCENQVAKTSFWTKIMAAVTVACCTPKVWPAYSNWKVTKLTGLSALFQRTWMSRCCRLDQSGSSLAPVISQIAGRLSFAFFSQTVNTERKQNMQIHCTDSLIDLWTQFEQNVCSKKRSLPSNT